MRKNNLLAASALVITLTLLGAGCKKNSPAAASSSASNDPAVEVPTTSTQFPATNLEYYLQSYRDKVLPATSKVDKKKLKAVIVVTGEDTADKKPLTINFYSDTKWSDGKERIFYIEEVKEGKSRYFGQFSSAISKFTIEASMLKEGKVIGDFLLLKGIKVNK